MNEELLFLLYITYKQKVCSFPIHVINDKGSKILLAQSEQ